MRGCRLNAPKVWPVEDGHLDEHDIGLKSAELRVLGHQTQKVNAAEANRSIG
jgi:hypothetical protein